MAATRKPNDTIPPPLSRNAISFLGWIVSCVLFFTMLILIGSDILFHKSSPYNSLITYLVLPGMLAGGVGLIFLGMALEWYRRHKAAPGEYPRLPVIDVNQGWQRWRILIGLALGSMFFAISAIGTYRAYHFTESPTFCGRICHQVMKPEYTAYQYSSHARVSCAECHIGAGADWYVKSKLSGLHQVYAVLTGTYHLPIKTPIDNLRPARETCEECHWPEKFSDSLEKVIWHFSPDQANTATRYNLLLKVGGAVPGGGPGRGIHWHIGHDVSVRYWARDHARQDIPWVEVSMGAKPPRVYRGPDCPDPLPKGAEIRTMDCIDCHNRPAHIFRSPRQLVDFFMGNRILDTALPYLKRYATEILSRPYRDTPTALATIASELKAKYQGQALGTRGQALVALNTDMLQQLYERNFFPEQGVDWRQYPVNIGHFEFPGCTRCHDERHKSTDGRTISNDCRMCHEFLDQAEGEAAFGPITYQGGPFRHPRNLGEIWKGHNCNDCHGLTATEKRP